MPSEVEKNKTKASAERICRLAENAGISVNKLLEKAGVSHSVVDRMKTGTMPSADKVSAIALILDVPSEFILGVGVFERWGLILQHKNAVLESISSMMSSLSANMRNGVDDITLIRLVWAYGLSVEINEYGRPEFGTMSPFAVLDTDISWPNAPEYCHNDVQEVMREFDKLDPKGRRIVFASIYEQQDRMSRDSKKTDQKSLTG